MQNDTVQSLEQNILQLKKVVELNAALERLQANRDFRKVIGEGLFRDEAVRLVSLKADPAMDTEAKQKSVIAQIDVIGGLQSWFRTVAFNAATAAKAIEGDEATIQEILEGGDE